MPFVFLFLVFLLASSVFADAEFKSEEVTLKNQEIKGDNEKFRKVASEVLMYLDRGQAFDPEAIHEGKLKNVNVTLSDVKATLEFIKKIAEEDIKTGNNRLSQSEFIEKNFKFVRWKADRQGVNQLAPSKPLLKNLPEDQILITKYYVKQGHGSPNKTAEKNVSLYGLPFDEAGLSLEEADKKRGVRFQFGKQEILKGALEQPKLLAPTLVYLNRQDLEDSLMQGTIVVELENKKKYFNVHRNNGIAYDRLKKPFDQERYWYFKEVKGVLGYGKDAEVKVAIETEVTVAGDIAFFGLGKVFLISRLENGVRIFRIVILADTGGAFQNNQFQLDWLSGYYGNYAEFQQTNKNNGDYGSVWVLVLK